MKNVTIRRSRPRAISKKREAERLAAGEKVIWRTVRPSPLSGSSIKKGRDKNAKQAKPRKAIAKENPERQAKRRKRYSAKLAAYRRSETFRVVEQRAAGQCEAEVQRGLLVGGVVPDSLWPWRRCTITEGLQHHHKTYSRFGGDELPEDIAVLCEVHHALIEAQHPTRRNGRRSNQQRNAS